MRRSIIYILSLVLCLSGCKWIEQQRNGAIIAQVGDKILYEADIENLVPLGTSSRDSLIIVYQYIQQWATNQLLYAKAVNNSGNKNEIEAMVENYRRLLYVHEYEQNLLQRRIPDSIPDDSVNAYYAKHHDVLRAKENYVKGLYLIVPKSTREISSLTSWLKNTTEDNLAKLEAFAYEKSLGYATFLDQWQTFSEIKLRIPIHTNNEMDWLHSNSFISLEDSSKIYLLRITDQILIGEELPIEIARTEISNVLHNGLQIKSLKKIEQELYDDGVRHGDIYLRNSKSLSDQLAELPAEQHAIETQPAPSPTTKPEPVEQPAPPVNNTTPKPKNNKKATPVEENDIEEPEIKEVERQQPEFDTNIFID